MLAQPLALFSDSTGDRPTDRSIGERHLFIGSSCRCLFICPLLVLALVLVICIQISFRRSTSASQNSKLLTLDQSEALPLLEANGSVSSSASVLEPCLLPLLRLQPGGSPVFNALVLISLARFRF